MLLIFALDGCAGLDRTIKQDTDWRKSWENIKEGEWVLITIKNKNRDLIPVCGQLIVAGNKTVRILHVGKPEKYSLIEEAITLENVAFGNHYILYLNREKIFSVEYCFKSTPDRRPLYRNYDP